MALNLHVPEQVVMKPSITVFGVGGAGGNATNNMIKEQLEGTDFVVANTDAQALAAAQTQKRIQLGKETTQGLGAGADPDMGGRAATEALDEISQYLDDVNMVFITAGMGGGTGTGAAPVIAKAAKDRGILTVGVVTKPFHFEGPRRMRIAEAGLTELQQYVDTLIVIPNQNLFRIANEQTTFADAFAMADEVLHAGVRGVTDLMVMPGLINLDFADVRSVMSEMGKAMMGTGESEGEGRAEKAADAAISNPLLDNVSMRGARGVLINITGGNDMTLFEVDQAANRIREEVDPNANIIFGSTFNESLNGKIRVSVVATGIGIGESLSSSVSTAISPKQEEVHTHEPHAKAGEEESPEIHAEIEESQEEEVKEAQLEEPSARIEQLFSEAELKQDNHAKVEEASTLRTIAQPASPLIAPDEPKTSFFDKVSAIGKLFRSSDHRDALRASVTTSERIKEEVVGTQDELTDVPAFLRRKKN